MEINEIKNYSSYPLVRRSEYEYEFVSNGRNGEIKEKLLFKPITSNLYELELLVYIEKYNKYAINTKIKNNDTLKVFATILVCMNNFSTRTGNNIIVKGFTTVHSKLFSLYISKYFPIISQYFYIYIIDEDNKICPFSKVPSKKYLFWKIITS